MARSAPGLLLAAFLLLCLLYNVTLPIFEAPDEGDHFHYADYLARERRLPDLARDLAVSHEIIQPPLYYALVAAVIAPFERANLPAISRLNPDWFDTDVNPDHRRVSNQYLHTAAEAFPYQGAVWAVRAARLFSSLLGALTVLLVYAIAYALTPLLSRGEEKGGARALRGEGHFALLAAALVALNPKFINISSIVSNDIAITFAATLACWWMVRMVNTGATRDGQGDGQIPDKRYLASSFILGALAGIATLCKVSGLGLLVPAAALVVLVTLRQRRTPRRAAGHMLLATLAIGAGLALTAGPWFAYNVAQYGHPLAWAQVQAANQSLMRPGGPLGPAQMLQAVPEVLISYWGALGVELRFPAWVDGLFFAALALAVLGCARKIGRMTKGAVLTAFATRHASFIVLAIWELALLASYLLWLRGYVGTENSRLLFPGVALIALLVTAGWRTLAPARLQGAVTWVACGSLFALSALTPFLVIRPAFAPPVYWSDAELAQLPGRAGITLDGKIRLQHAQINQRNATPGVAVSVSLFWGALQPLKQSYHVILAARDAQGQLIGRLEAIPFGGRFDTQHWEPGRLFRDDYQLPIDAAAGRGPATVQLSVRGVYETPPLLPIDGAGTDQFTIGRVKVLGPAGVPAAPQHVVEASFAEAGTPAIELEGFDLQTSGDRRILLLHWRCIKQPNQDYTLFVHVLDRDGTIISQEDAQPLNGAYPTSMWDAQEQIIDRRAVELPAAAASLRIGWYVKESGERLEATKPDGTPWQDNAVLAHLPAAGGR